MQIKILKEFDISDLYTFNKQVFPARCESNKIIDFWFSKSIAERNLSAILISDLNEIWGQVLTSSMNYYYKNYNYTGKWIFDYIIREDKRKDGYGIDLLQFLLKYNKTPIFATGSGPLALKIELKMGFKLVGKLKKYLGIVNPFYIISSIFRGTIPVNRFQTIVKVNGETFSLMTNPDLPDITKPFNYNLLEFGRDKSFLSWRFYSRLHEYAIYKKDGADDYFVLRTIVNKNITCMVLVDYRCDLNYSESFKLIIKAAKKVSKRLRLSILITGSSLRLIDTILEKQYFKAVGRHRPIISSKLFREEKDKIKKREFVFTTLADSDGEINWY